MKKFKISDHKTAPASYYNSRAEVYDQFNEEALKSLNGLVEAILKRYSIQTVLDMTCGTGSQVFWLVKAGFDLVGSDISRKMLAIARQKAKNERVKVRFLQGDCRTIEAGTFDALITMFNSIGHLTKQDFELTLQNIHKQLKPGGLYIFDIFNLDYLLHEKNISRLTIDWITTMNNKQVREIQFSTITKEGVLASYSTYVEQEADSNQILISKAYQNTLQIYSAEELKKLLEKNDFILLEHTSVDGTVFIKEQTERILLVAQKN
jgi:ubiquinone/menaquinone biosynthesis C-methylase UbiE